MPTHTVCVTGASGFIAGHVIDALLARGHSVVGTLRSDEKAIHTEPHYAHLADLQARVGKARLRFVSANLMDRDSLLNAVSGMCINDVILSVVSHTNNV